VPRRRRPHRARSDADVGSQLHLGAQELGNAALGHRQDDDLGRVGPRLEPEARATEGIEPESGVKIVGSFAPVTLVSSAVGEPMKSAREMAVATKATFLLAFIARPPEQRLPQVHPTRVLAMRVFTPYSGRKLLLGLLVPRDQHAAASRPADDERRAHHLG
jgi:hypothetical protein